MEIVAYYVGVEHIVNFTNNNLDLTWFDQPELMMKTHGHNTSQSLLGYDYHNEIHYSQTGSHLYRGNGLQCDDLLICSTYDVFMLIFTCTYLLFVFLGGTCQQMFHTWNIISNQNAGAKNWTKHFREHSDETASQYRRKKKLPWVPITSSFRMNSSTAPSASLLSLSCFNSPFLWWRTQPWEVTWNQTMCIGNPQRWTARRTTLNMGRSKNESINNSVWYLYL